MPSARSAPRVVLVTGVSRFPGSVVAGELAADASISRVIGVDTAPPAPQAPAGVEFVRADIRNPLIAKVIDSAGVDTVAHLALDRFRPRSVSKEMNVIGSMQLLAACQKSSSVRKLVVKSSTDVYGSSESDPAVFEETDEPPSGRSHGGSDAIEIEGYVRGFARRRPDVALSVLRLANVIGPALDSPLTKYFSLPAIPVVAGFDPRIQLLHADDTATVLCHAVRSDVTGTVNVAGSGVLALRQAIRRAGRLPVPMPRSGLASLVRLGRRAGLTDFTVEQTRFLNFGPVVDTSRLRRDFGYDAVMSTVEAFDDFVRGAGLTPMRGPDLLVGVERIVAGISRRRAAGRPR